MSTLNKRRESYVYSCVMNKWQEEMEKQEMNKWMNTHFNFFSGSINTVLR